MAASVPRSAASQLENGVVVVIAAHRISPMPPQILDGEELHPGEEAVDPVLQIGAKMDGRLSEIEARLADELRGMGLAGFRVLDLNDAAVKKCRIVQFEEYEAQSVGCRIERARIEQLEIEAAESRGLQARHLCSVQLRMIEHGQVGLAGSGGEGVAVAYDLAADENRARDRLIDALDIGTHGLSCRSSGPPVGRPRSFGAVVAQIAVAQRGEAVQMTEQSMPGCRVAAATVPDDDDGGHRKSRFIVEGRNRPTLRWLAAARKARPSGRVAQIQPATDPLPFFAAGRAG